ncbi:excalibur calcium-binding domain-containing protein [Lysobacter enzymogenes]|uniref:YHYH domain-containing protein n=1 Tax=Lysobacter enzymogenes TaxID=69 RepID=A0A3N2RLD2_LYSEN|nr:excalibur calcium-binding domain-containing protein [Lysobacter enzymogenes]ROU08146.1 YHYH domain-containing protein [Lysobacter enzymogenes]
MQPNHERRRRSALAALLALLAAAPSAASAHGGGLDRHGCHHDRRNGGYHCHRGGAPAATAVASGPGRTDLQPPQQRGIRPASTGAGARRDATAYPNCAAARAAGAAPLLRGDPGYSRRLDRDGDGRACE